MSFKFNLGQGAIGEAFFYSAHETILDQTDGRQGDFKEKATGAVWEVKTDMYSMDRTPNFFMERWSDVDAKKPGGPWQALEHGCKYFAYFFAPNLTYFKFEVDKLVSELEAAENTYSPFPVKNKSWTTIGYRVPRESLKAIYKQVVLGAYIKEEQ